MSNFLPAEDSFTAYHEYEDYFGIKHIIKGSIVRQYDIRTDDVAHKLTINDNDTKTVTFPKPDYRTNIKELLYTAVLDYQHEMIDGQAWRAEVQYKGALTPWGRK